jgi:hypothetical protein
VKLKTYTPTPEIQALMADLKAALAKHPQLMAVEMLAAVAQLCGNLTALQDQTVLTSDMVMEIVARNLEVGNAAAVNGLRNAKAAGEA